MRRNYIKELKSLGYSYQRIASETGYSRDMISSIASGRRAMPKAGSDKYESIRNVSRRATYNEALDRGLPASVASDFRRKAPKEIKKFTGKHWKVESTITGTTEYQLAIIADFYSEKQQDYAYNLECYSNVYIKVRLALMLDECETFGRWKLGGSDWSIVKIHKQIITEIKP